MSAGARIAALLYALPDRVPIWLGCLGLAGVLSLQLGAVRAALVLPLAVLLVVLTWRAVPPPPGRGRAAWLAWAFLLVFLACWVVLGIRVGAEYVVVNRDPGFLTLRALWWTHHADPAIPVGRAEQVAASVPGASAATEAFALTDGALQPQGNAMLPALLAAMGWVGGDRGVLAGSVLIGAVALLAVYALGRRLVGPVLGLLPTVALACCLPFLVFTRAAYTEPLAVALLCGGLSVIVARGGGSLRYLTAGAMLGGVATARIDGGTVVAGLSVGAGLLAWAPLGRSARRVLRRRAVALIAGAVALQVLGLVDVWRFSRAYAEEHRAQITQLVAATAAAVLIAVVLLALSRWDRGVLRRAVWSARRRLGSVVAVLVLVVGAALVSRPLWYEGHHMDAASPYGGAVEILQQAAGQPLDGTRSYDELTLTWTSWYLGWPSVLLGFAGCALLARRAVAGRRAAPVLLLAVLMVAGLFPVVLINITPDQIWASRRLLPATYPMLLIGAGVTVDAVWRARWWRRPVRAVVAVVLALSMLVPPVIGWRGVAGVRELSGRYAQAIAVCAALEGAGAQRVVWVHSSPFRYLGTLRVMCDVEVVEFLTPPSAAELVAVRAAWGGGTVAAASFDVEDLPWVNRPTAAVGRIESSTLGRELNAPPTRVDTTLSDVWWGIVGADGRVTPPG